MMWKQTTVLILAGSIGFAPTVGCESLPGNEKEQGAVIGGVGGAAAGAAIGGKDHRLAGALIGGALGAGGGYLVGSKMEKDKNKSDEQIHKEATAAADKAEKNPATADDAKRATTADINNDGYVTLDEVVAMEKAGLSDREMVRRLERTQQYFELTSDQERYLADRGVSRDVIDEMRNMKPDDARTASDRDENIDLRTDPGRPKN